VTVTVPLRFFYPLAVLTPPALSQISQEVSPLSRFLLFFLFSFSFVAGICSDLTVIVDQDDLTTWAGSGSDIDPRGLIVLDDGSLVYFEDDSGLGNNGDDALIHITPGTSPTIAVLVPEYFSSSSDQDLLDSPGSGSCCAYGADLATDGEVIYALISDTSASANQAINYVVRIAPDAQGNYVDPQVMTALWNGGFDSGQKLPPPGPDRRNALFAL
jgi:hypothetical protein